jgi:antirestriction protein ArdC
MKVSEIVKTKVLELFEKIENQDWETPYLFPRNFTSKHEYRGINRLLLFSSPYWLTNNQLKELHKKKGWRLKKGSKSSIAVFFKPQQIEVIEKDKEGNDVEVVKEIPILRYYYVFPILDVVDENGKPVYKPVKETDRTKDLLSVLKSYCQIEGIRIIETTLLDASYYSQDTDMIGMYPFIKDDIDYAMTFAHEIVHSTLHEKRLDRKVDKQMEEAVAEIGSLILSAKYINIPENKFKNAVVYIKGWLQGVSGTKLIKAFSYSDKAVEFVVKQASLNQKVS